MHSTQQKVTSVQREEKTKTLQGSEGAEEEEEEGRRALKPCYPEADIQLI